MTEISRTGHPRVAPGDPVAMPPDGPDPAAIDYGVAEQVIAAQAPGMPAVVVVRRLTSGGEPLADPVLCTRLDAHLSVIPMDLLGRAAEDVARTELPGGARRTVQDL